MENIFMKLLIFISLIIYITISSGCNSREKYLQTEQIGSTTPKDNFLDTSLLLYSFDNKEEFRCSQSISIKSKEFLPKENSLSLATADINIDYMEKELKSTEEFLRSFKVFPSSQKSVDYYNSQIEKYNSSLDIFKQSLEELRFNW